VGSVGSVQIIGVGDGRSGHTTVGLDEGKGVQGEDDGITILVSGLNGDLEVLVGGQGGIGSGQDIDGERSIFDLRSFEGDVDFDGSGLVRSVGNSVGPVAVVFDIGADIGFFGTSDLDNERIATIDSGVAFVINGMDGELCGLVILDLTVFDTFSGGI